MNYESHIKPYGDELAFVYRFFDIVTMILSMYIISMLYLGEFNIKYQLVLCIVVLTYFFITELSGIYRSHFHVSLERTLSTIVISWLSCLLLVLAIGFALKVTVSYSRVVLTSWFVIAPILLITWRLIALFVANKLRNQDDYKNSSIIIGATKAGLVLANELKDSKGYTKENLIGFFDDRPIERIEQSMSITNLPVNLCGSVDDALKLAKSRRIKNVYIALPMEASKRIKAIIETFTDSNVHVHFVPDLFTFNLMHSRWKNIGGLVTLSVHDTPFRGVTSILKRIEDIVLSTIIIIAILPVLVFVAIGVKLSSPGPIIFKQDRYGLDGCKIKVWKFRSMRSTDNGNVVKQATVNDPRVTTFGNFIRRTSLDELPQFFNVLSGSMSIVGPRPHAVAHNEEYRSIVDKYMLRHHVKPGITGLAQISGYRGETDTLDKMEKRVEYDLKYIKEWSVFLDIKIIFLTIFKGFVGKTAY